MKTKKIIAGLMAMVCVTAISGCGEKEPSSEESNSVQETTVTEITTEQNTTTSTNETTTTTIIETTTIELTTNTGENSIQTTIAITKPSKTITTTLIKTSKKTTKASNIRSVTNERTVYVTKTGKKYHYSSSCNGGSYTPTTLDKAKARGLSPCKKCVG